MVGRFFSLSKSGKVLLSIKKEKNEERGMSEKGGRKKRRNYIKVLI